MLTSIIYLLVKMWIIEWTCSANLWIVNIVLNFIHNKIILLDDRKPLWLSNYIKFLIKLKNAEFNKHKFTKSFDPVSLSKILSKRCCRFF